MAGAPTLTWQASLFDGGAPDVDATFAGLVRHDLDAGAWADHLPGWVSGADRLFSLGHPRTLRLRPRAGGSAPIRAFTMRRGDLLVMGGSSQRTWEHAVPKVALAGPRISIVIRHRE